MLWLGKKDKISGHLEGDYRNQSRNKMSDEMTI